MIDRSVMKRVALVVAIVAAVVIGVSSVRRALRGSSSAFDETMQFSRELVYEGVNVYEVYGVQGTHTKYPPFFFVFTAPFAALPMVVAAPLWFLLNLALAVAGVILAVRAFRPRDADPPPWTTYALVALANVAVLGGNLGRGQVNILIVFFVVASIWAAARAKDDLAGFTLAIAFMLKLTPVLLLAYYVWKRRWRTLRGFAVGAILCAGVQALVLAPMEHDKQVTHAWLGVLSEFAKGGVLAEGDPAGIRHTNQSLAAAVFRFGTDRPANGEGGGLYLNVLSLPDGVANTVVRVLSALLLLATAWWTRGRTRDPSDLSFGAGASLVLVLMLLVSPISWSNHYVALLVPWAVAFQGGKSRLLGPAFVLSLAALSPYALAFSLQMLGAVLLAVAISSPCTRPAISRRA